VPVALSSLDVALAGVITTGLVAVIGSVVTSLVARGNRQHERDLQRGERLFEKRGAIYVDLFRWADVHLVRVERTNPIITMGPPLQPPDPPPEAELVTMQAQVAVYGSSAVWQLIEEFAQAVRDFFFASSMLEIEQRRQTADTTRAWEALTEKRTEVRTLHLKLRLQVQQEIERL
jgi:hypothetical protein